MDSKRLTADLLYGFFWYPLWVLGTAEALRAAELALEVASAAARAPERATTAESRIEWLGRRRVLGAPDAATWMSVIGERDALAASGDTPILTPGKSLGVLETVARAMNGLFSYTEDTEEGEE
jgi:hypothetical protein